MAFEQNMALQRLMNPMAMQMPSASWMNNFPAPRPQSPMMSFGPTQNANKGFWGNLKDMTLGSDGQFAYSTPYGQDQQNAFQRLLQMGIYNQQNPYEGFEPLQQSISNYYQQQVLPQILERFTGSGAGALGSPDFAKQVISGNQGLADMLLQHKMNYGNQNRQFGLQQSQIGLTPQFENSYIPGQPGLLQSFFGQLGPIAGAAANYFSAGALGSGANRRLP